MMKKPVKISAVAGISLFILAALFSISLISVLLDFGTMSPVHDSVFLKTGRMFTEVYGFTSVLIPLFCIFAGIECFVSNWNMKRAILLLGSVVPFFTIYFCEKFCRNVVATCEPKEISVKIFMAVALATILVMAEAALMLLIGGILDGEDKGGEAEKRPVEAKDDIFEEEIVEEFPIDADADVEEADNENEVAGEQEYAFETVKIQSDEPNPFDHVFDEIEPSSYEPVFVPQENEEEESGDEEIQENDIPAEENFVPEPSPFEEEMEESFEEPVVNEDAFTEEAVDGGDAAEGEQENEEDFADPVSVSEFFNEEIEESADEAFAAEAGGEEVSDDIFETEENAEAEDNAVEEVDFDPEQIEAEIQAEEKDESFSEEDFLATDIQFDDEEDIIGEFENTAAIETEQMDNTIDIDPAFFGVDLNAEDDSEESKSDDIFAQMEADASREPVLDDLNSFENSISFQDEENNKDVSEDLPDDIYDSELSAEDFDAEYEYDPSAKPVLDANGNTYQEETSIPFDTEEINLEDIPVELQNALKNNRNSMHSSMEQTVFADSGSDSEENLPPVPEGPKVVFDERTKPVEKKKPKLRMSNYKVPVDLLQEYASDEYWVIDDETKQKGEDLKQTLAEFNIEVEVTGIRKGPVVTMFEVLPAPGVNVNKIRTLQDNIALRLAATSVRIVAPIPGKSAVGIEIPNETRAVVGFREIMEQKNPNFDKMAIPVILGKDISGDPQLIDLAKTPHLLIAGSTGAGKSVCVNSLILSILYKRSPQQVKMILIDPKVVELKLYNDIPHLLTPVITEPKKALQSLQYCLCEMERRYALLDGMGVRDISNYNRRIVERNIATEKLPYIVVIIDEFADLMATTGRELESNVARLCAMSRAVGIHLVLATQRPSVNVITGLIKANIPSRIAFMVASRTDSNIIIDQIGAEKLLGKGDMLYASATDPFPVRIQGTLVVDDEVENVVEYVKQYGEPDYIDDEIFVDDEDEGDGANPGLFSDGADPLYDQALQIVIQAGKASASYIQRRLKIGYNRAARLVEEMEERGIVGPANGSKPREVIHAPN